MRSQSLSKIIISSLIAIITWFSSSPAWALISIQLSDLGYKDCPPSLSKGISNSGSLLGAKCFIITGKAKNTSNKTAYDADVYGRIYDANNNNAMQNRTRLGAIKKIPARTTTDFEIRISIPANLPTPLKLKSFKSSGFSSKVRWEQNIKEFEEF